MGRQSYLVRLEIEKPWVEQQLERGNEEGAYLMYLDDRVRI